MPPTDNWPIKVLSQSELTAWRDGVRGAEAQAMKLAEVGYVPLAFLNDDWFTWLCPGCGCFTHGRVGDTWPVLSTRALPLSGWDNPRWTVEGLPEHLTMMPSFGCPRWRDGTCTGHWFARDGRLVPA